MFAETGIAALGFCAPYLRREAHLQATLDAAGSSYVSNQPIVWDVLDVNEFNQQTYAEYGRAIHFYGQLRASEHLSLPQLRDQLVEIPLSLLDYEMLFDRLEGGSRGLVEKTWRRILSQTHQREELFTV